MTQTNQPAHARAGETYTVVTDKLELPRGARFNVEPGPVESSRLAMIQIGQRATIGFYYSDIAGFDWIVQPDLMIKVTGKIPVLVVGPVAPLR
jgi:hypothetical protein